MEKHDLLVILNALVEPVLLVDENRRVTLANRAADELFGEGLVGQDFVYATRHPDALESIEAALANDTAGEAVITLHAPARATYRLSCVPFGGSDGAEREIVVSLNDISHVLEAEQMRSDFVANVSHELRSPLTALIGGIETLQGPAKSDPKARERFLDIMEREAARMNRLVGDLLSLSQVEINEYVRPSEQVNVVSIVERVVAALETRKDDQTKAIKLHVPEGDFVVTGDADELTQVFQNLIDNALKYSREDSKVDVSLSRRERVAGVDGPVVAVSVADKGEGIPAEHIPRLTERFYRVDNSRSRAKGGTGLGLAIVKHVLNRHRGKLLIESEPDIGSTFTVCLPLNAPVQNAPLS